MAWRILYIDEGNYLSLYLDNIKIESADKKRSLVVQIKDIHTLIIDNYRSTLTTHLINALTRKNVNVVLCDVDHMPQSIIIPILGNKKAPLMLRKQLSWGSRIKKAIHQEVVKAKLENQIEILALINADADTIMKIKQYKREVLPGDKTNREGLAAKVYFRALFGTKFRRFNADTINAALNYGYSILRSQISKTILAKGLNPALGFFHHGPNNHFNLSDDFIEPFRPLIDYHVYQYLRKEKVLTKEHKLSLIESTTKKISFRGQMQTIFNAINQYVDTVVDFAQTGNYDKLEHPKITINDI